MAMSRDNMLPPSLRAVSRRFGTPYVGILLTSGFMIAIISLLNIRDLVKVASTMKLILFLLMNVAVLIMRGSRIQNYRPLYRCPLFPWLQLAGIIMYVFLIVEMTGEMDWLPLATTAVFAAAGTLWYFLYVRPRTTRVSALAYMVRNVVAREIRHIGLEDELREIALERDLVGRDRFDDLIRNCAILDFRKPISAEEMFRAAAKELAGRIGADESNLLKLLQTRESQSSTVVEPGLAIPHVIVEGRKCFDVLLARCKKGIRFPGHDEPVRVAFVLVGSADERNYHLRALMAIAHVVQEHGFVRRWLDAPDREHLRDIVLLSGRSRDVSPR